MSEQASSRDLVGELRRWHALKGADCFREAADKIERLQRELDGANKTIAHFMGPEGEKYIDRFAALLSGPVSLEESIRRYSAPEPSPAASNEKVCDDELRIIYEHGQPCGIRDRSGFLFFFRKVSKYQGQEERYRRELEQMARLADFLLSALRTAPEPETVVANDACELCSKPLPHVDEWSMPSCPDCQEVLEFLGELEADYADRERLGKAELVASAIKLICRKPSGTGRLLGESLKAQGRHTEAPGAQR